MTAQEYLKQIEKYERIIESRVLEIEDLKSHARLSYVGAFDNNRVQTSRRADGSENLIIKYIEKEEELQNLIFECWEKRQEIIKTIEQLKVQEYDLLYGVYVKKNTLQEVADRFDKSYSWATTTKRMALDNLQKILDERKKHAV